MLITFGIMYDLGRTGVVLIFEIYGNFILQHSDVNRRPAGIVGEVKATLFSDLEIPDY